MARRAPEAFGSKVNKTVMFFHPETDKLTRFTVLGFGISKSKGRWFTVTYTGTPDVEVELSEQEMEEILTTHVDIKD